MTDGSEAESKGVGLGWKLRKVDKSVIVKPTEVAKAFAEGRKTKKKITVVWNLSLISVLDRSLEVFGLDQDSMLTEWEKSAVKIQSAQRKVAACKLTELRKVCRNLFDMIWYGVIFVMREVCRRL